MMGVSLLLLGLRVDPNGDGHGWSLRKPLGIGLRVGAGLRGSVAARIAEGLALGNRSGSSHRKGEQIAW